MSAQRQPANVTPLPGPQVLGALEAFIKQVVRQEMNAAPLAQRSTPRSIRMEKGFELCQLAAAAKLSHVTLSKLERGLIQRPKQQTLSKIAAALNIPAAEYRQAVAALLQNG